MANGKLSKLHPYALSYVTYSSLHPNSSPSLSYLIKNLNKFRTGDLVLLLSKINLSLTRSEFIASIDFQNTLHSLFFDNYIKGKIDKLRAKDKTQYIFFHRQQLLYLMKLAILNCKNDYVIDKWQTQERYIIGRCCLVANDFLGLYKGIQEDLDKLDKEEKKKILLKEFFPTYEFWISKELSSEIGRMRIIFKHILPTQINNPNYLSFDDVFQNAYKISFKNFMYLVFSIIALYLDRRKAILDDPRSIFITTNNFTSGSKIIPESVRSVLTMLSLPLDAYRQNILDFKDEKYSFSFIVFRKYPLIRYDADSFYCIDLDFLINKLSDGSFWMINDCLDGTNRAKFHLFWGLLFEQDIKLRIANNGLGAVPHFIANPRTAGGEEIADGLLLFTNEIVIMEFKFALLTQAAKYTSSYDIFHDEIVNKLEKNTEGNWKGYGQLANTINRLFGKEGKTSCEHIDKGKIKIIYPILITYDNYFNTPLMNQFFNRAFQELIDYKNLAEGLEIKPLILISIEDFEMSLSFLNSFNGLLQERIDFDPQLIVSFSDFLKKRKSKELRYPKIILDEYRIFADEVSDYVFGTKLRKEGSSNP